MPSCMGNNGNATSHTQLLCCHHCPGVQLGSPTGPTQQGKYRTGMSLGLYHVQHGVPGPTSSEQSGRKVRASTLPTVSLTALAKQQPNISCPGCAQQGGFRVPAAVISVVPIPTGLQTDVDAVPGVPLEAAEPVTSVQLLSQKLKKLSIR